MAKGRDESDLSKALRLSLGQQCSELLTSNRKKAAAFLSECGLRLIPIPGDGACLFRTVSLHIYHTMDQHLDLRRQAVEWMSKHRNELKPFFDEAAFAQFDSYCVYMLEPCSWGGHPELFSISRITGRRCCIFSLDQSPICWSPNESSDNEDSREVEDDGKDDGEMLMLWYHRDNHYDCVVREEDYELLSTSVMTSMESSIRDFSEILKDDYVFRSEENWSVIPGSRRNSSSKFPSSVLQRHSSAAPQVHRNQNGNHHRNNNHRDHRPSHNTFAMLLKDSDQQDEEDNCDVIKSSSSFSSSSSGVKVDPKRNVPPEQTGPKPLNSKQNRRLAKKLKLAAAREPQKLPTDRLLVFLCAALAIMIVVLCVLGIFKYLQRASYF